MNHEHLHCTSIRIRMYEKLWIHLFYIIVNTLIVLTAPPLLQGLMAILIILPSSVSAIQIVNSSLYLATRAGIAVSVEISESHPTIKELHGHSGDVYSILPLGSRVLPRQWLPSIIGRINVMDRFPGEMPEESIKVIQDGIFGRSVDILLTVGKGFYGLGKSNPLASASDTTDSFLLLWVWGHFVLACVTMVKKCVTTLFYWCCHHNHNCMQFVRALLTNISFCMLSFLCININIHNAVRKEVRMAVGNTSALCSRSMPCCDLMWNLLYTHIFNIRAIYTFYICFLQYIHIHCTYACSMYVCMLCTCLNSITTSL